MNVVQTLSGPVIGAVIGYFTNYIAVKMLFRPLYPVKLGKLTLPFTPGVIPKRKNELAAALGSMVGNTLITREDLEKALLSDGMKQSVIDGIVKYVTKQSDTTRTVKDTLNCFMDEKDYQEFKLQIEQLLSEKIAAGLSQIDLGAIIANKGGAALKEKVQGTMLAMMLNDKLIESFAEPIGEKVKEYLQNHGAEKIQPVVIEEIKKLENQTISDVLGKIPINEKQIKELAGSLYNDCIKSTSDSIIKQIDVVEIVKNKVMDMDVKDIERLVLSVMKKELSTVVNLGAGLGFIIGLLNLFF
jgi:uncharacterized membrane protein YheB (UPF0754 family)